MAREHACPRGRACVWRGAAADTAGRLLIADTAGAAEFRTASWPADGAAVRALLEGYFAALRSNLLMPPRIRGIDRSAELHGLEEAYRDANRRVLILACVDGQPIGCIAVSLLPSREASAEVKRLYVAPGARGRGLGHSLLQVAVTWAEARGAREVLLDTIPEAMPEAVRLYRAAGFVPTDRYNGNAEPEFAFYRLPLE